MEIYFHRNTSSKTNIESGHRFYKIVIFNWKSGHRCTKKITKSNYQSKSHFPYFLSHFILKFGFFPLPADQSVSTLDMFTIIHCHCESLPLWIFCVFQKIIKHQYFCWQNLHLNLKYLKHIKSKKRKSGKASEYFFAHFKTRTKYWEEIAIDCECSWKSHIWQWKLLDLLRFRIFGQIAEWNYDGLSTWYLMRKTIEFDNIPWSISGHIIVKKNILS